MNTGEALYDAIRDRNVADLVDVIEKMDPVRYADAKKFVMKSDPPFIGAAIDVLNSPYEGVGLGNYVPEGFSIDALGQIASPDWKDTGPNVARLLVEFKTKKLKKVSDTACDCGMINLTEALYKIGAICDVGEHFGWMVVGSVNRGMLPSLKYALEKCDGDDPRVNGLLARSWIEREVDVGRMTFDVGVMRFLLGEGILTRERVVKGKYLHEMANAGKIDSLTFLMEEVGVTKEDLLVSDGEMDAVGDAIHGERGDVVRFFFEECGFGIEDLRNQRYVEIAAEHDSRLPILKYFVDEIGLTREDLPKRGEITFADPAPLEFMISEMGITPQDVRKDVDNARKDIGLALEEMELTPLKLSLYNSIKAAIR